MRPIVIEKTNAVYQKDGCGDLPVVKLEDRIISTWKFSPKEIELLRKSRQISLHVWGQNQPPVALEITNYKEIRKNENS